MALIGILSDTHGFVPENSEEFFAGCEEIWHAGDIGAESVLAKLTKIAPLRAVYGNIDDQMMRKTVREINIFQFENQKIIIKHITGYPGRYEPETKNLISKLKPNIVIGGHSHILKIQFDKKNNLLFINPGAAGKHGIHKQQTMVRLQIENGVIKNADIWELDRNKSI